MGENINDHIDLRRLSARLLPFPPSRPDSAYCTASDQMSSRCDPFSRPASRQYASPFSLLLVSPVNRNTRAIDSSVAQYKSPFAIVKELGNGVDKDCGSENGDCLRLEATFGLRPQDQCF
jgi:hypothetical protein